ncbi:hypothetical protein SMC26_29185 [Actinomadura fulvescens]|uniref:Uncharacterized protein n=1 Tax=Actinomadura fulvescens TaxID=46160 RepID=A0ABP6CCE3_9ACTN
MQTPTRPSNLAITTALRELTWDTFAGVASFVVPGRDAHSAAQGTPRAESGALESQVPDFLILGIDFSMENPDVLSRPIAAGLRSGLNKAPLGSLPVSLGDAAGVLLDEPAPVPLTDALALLLCFLAVETDPASAYGDRFPSPFARLTAMGKGRVFAQLEDPVPGLVDRIAAHAAEPLRPALAGQLTYVGGVLLEFAAIGAYIDWQIFDPRTRTTGARPLSWDLTGFQPDGPLDGWDDLRGYYQGRRKTEA